MTGEVAAGETGRTFCPACGHLDATHGTKRKMCLACERPLNGPPGEPCPLTINGAIRFDCAGCDAVAHDLGGDETVGWVWDDDGAEVFCPTCVATPAPSSTTPAALSEAELGALRIAVDKDEACSCHEDNDTSHLAAAVERILTDRLAAARAPERDGLAERVEAVVAAPEEMSDGEGDAWDALHDDTDIICTCDGCNYYSPTYDDQRECSLNTHIESIVAARLADIVANLLPTPAPEEAERPTEREVRNEWADYFESWSGAVGPKPPTVEDVVRLLRAEGKPFGCAAPETSGVESRG